MPIFILIAAIAFVIWRLPKPLEETPGQFAHLTVRGYRFRRGLNWLIAGLSYAFLVFGRYNLNAAIKAIGGNEMVKDFNWIFGAGTIAYGISFLLNGPLTDRRGGRFSLAIGVAGAMVANMLMAIVTWRFQQGAIDKGLFFWTLLVLYVINMYFQSFGAVAIVKISASWFHVRERGVFGAVFGILISLGIYFAYDWSNAILNTFKWSVPWVFAIPSAFLAVALIGISFCVRNRPSDAGFADPQTGDASEGDTKTQPDPAITVFTAMLKNPIIMTICGIEFCSGFLRQSVMQQYPLFAKLVGFDKEWVMKNWGLLLCCAGILGGVIAGLVSDKLFQSKRAMAALPMYAVLFLGGALMLLTLGIPLVGWVAVFMSFAVIGVHGLLSGTATQDFGGTKNAGVATGLVDGFVYLGTGFQSLLYIFILPSGEAAKDTGHWIQWPISMIPMAVIGTVLCWNIRHAKPKRKA